jgi:hypothetical protein
MYIVQNFTVQYRTMHKLQSLKHSHGKWRTYFVCLKISSRENSHTRRITGLHLGRSTGPPWWGTIFAFWRDNMSASHPLLPFHFCHGCTHKVLTYVEYRAVSGVFQNIDPPPPSPHSECVLPPAPKAGGHTRRAVRGWWSIFWKTPDIGLASYGCTVQ